MPTNEVIIAVLQLVSVFEWQRPHQRDVAHAYHFTVKTCTYKQQLKEWLLLAACDSLMNVQVLGSSSFMIELPLYSPELFTVSCLCLRHASFSPTTDNIYSNQPHPSLSAWQPNLVYCNVSHPCLLVRQLNSVLFTVTCHTFRFQCLQ